MGPPCLKKVPQARARMLAPFCRQRQVQGWSCNEPSHDRWSEGLKQTDATKSPTVLLIQPSARWSDQQCADLWCMLTVPARCCHCHALVNRLKTPISDSIMLQDCSNVPATNRGCPLPPSHCSPHLHHELHHVKVPVDNGNVQGCLPFIGSWRVMCSTTLLHHSAPQGNKTCGEATPSLPNSWLPCC